MSEDEKKLETGQAISGRKASLSGLGAFKHLKKISSAVQVHKEKVVSKTPDLEAAPNVPQKSVEQKSQPVFEYNSNTSAKSSSVDSNTIRIQSDSHSNTDSGVFEYNSNTKTSDSSPDEPLKRNSKSNSKKNPSLVLNQKSDSKAPSVFEYNSNTDDKLSQGEVKSEAHAMDSLTTAEPPSVDLTAQEMIPVLSTNPTGPAKNKDSVFEYNSNTNGAMRATNTPLIKFEADLKLSDFKNDYVTLNEPGGKSVFEYNSDTIRIQNINNSNQDQGLYSNTAASVSEYNSNTIIQNDHREKLVLKKESDSTGAQPPLAADSLSESFAPTQVTDLIESSEDTRQALNQMLKESNSKFDVTLTSKTPPPIESLSEIGSEFATTNIQPSQIATATSQFIEPVIEPAAKAHLQDELASVKTPIVSEYNSNRIRIQEADYSKTDRRQFEYKADTNSNTDSNRIRIQNNPDDVETKLRELASTGAQIFRFLFEKCVGNHSYETGKVFRHEMIESLGLSSATIKTITTRMVSKKLLSVVSYKTGSGGWTIYALNTQAFEIFHKDRSILERSINAKTSQPELTKFEYNSNTNSDTDSNTKRSSKLVSNYKYTNYLENPDGLDEVDLAGVLQFGITKSIVTDIRKNNWKISRDQLESLVYRFEKWGSQPGSTRGIKNLRGLFCGHLKQISETGHDPLDFIKTESEMLIEQLIEKRKASLLEMKRRQNELLDLEFSNWEQGMDRSELLQVLPPSNIIPFGSELYHRSLKAYFTENIWPKLSQGMGL